MDPRTRYSDTLKQLNDLTGGTHQFKALIHLTSRYNPNTRHLGSPVTSSQVPVSRGFNLDVRKLQWGKLEEEQYANN